jgi:hypothetical protein
MPRRHAGNGADMTPQAYINLRLHMDAMDADGISYPDLLAYMLKESSSHEMLSMLNDALWDLEIQLRNELAEATRDCEENRFRIGK